MDARAVKLKALFMDSVEKLEPGASAELAKNPEKAASLDAIADNVVKAFDILMDKTE